MQHLEHMRSHTMNIFKALSKICNVMYSVELHINKIEEDIKARKMEGKTTQFNKNIHHINRILEVFFEF